MDEDVKNILETYETDLRALAGCVTTLQAMAVQHHEAIKRLIELSEED